MAGDPATGDTSVISGWTAFSNPAFVKSALADLQAMNAADNSELDNTDAPVADLADATIPIPERNDVLSDGSPSDSEPTQEEKDELLIADPPRLTGEALVDLASRFSTADIVNFSNEATGGNLTRAAINGRLNAALTKKAKALGTTKLLLKEELTEHRKTRGIRSTRQEPDHRHAAVGGDTQTGGDKTFAGGETQVSENDQADEDVQATSAPQTDAATNTDQPKGSDATEESSAVDTEAAAAAAVAVAEDDEFLAAQQQEDEEAFQDQNSLKGEKILLLAERYSNADISARICGILGNYPLTENGVATRIHKALETKAKATGETIHQLRYDLNDARIASGAVKATPRGRGIMRSSRGAKAATSVRFPKHSPVTKAPVAQAKRLKAVKQGAKDEEQTKRPKKRAKKTHDSTSSVATPLAVQVDAEMTGDDSAGSQDGYDAKEVEAANALLELADGGAEVREAATILMDMHRGSVRSDGQSGLSDGKAGNLDDSEMNDA